MSDFESRLAAMNGYGLRIAELEAQVRKLRTALADASGDRTHTKLRVCVRQLGELIEERDGALDRIRELEQLLGAARDVAIMLEGEVDACPDEEWHDAYAYAFPDVDGLVAARDRHPAGSGLES